jgi:hypothetical protein
VPKVPKENLEIDREGGQRPLIWLKGQSPKESRAIRFEEDTWQEIYHFGEITLEERGGVEQELRRRESEFI